MDTSSSASIAAYINSLTYSLDSQQKWYKASIASNSWNISKCTFCAFNAFDGTDVRVEARIPGGVKSFIVDVLGSKKGTEPDCWQETFISSILRALKDCHIYENTEDLEDRSKAKRCLDGLLNLQTEMKFLETASKLFHKGRHLGSPRGPHIAGNHDNYLTLGVVGYFCSTGRPEISIGFLKSFCEKDESLKSLMIKCLFLASKNIITLFVFIFICPCMYLDNQQLAIKTLTLKPYCFDQMTEFLMSRGHFDKAEHFASEALKIEPNSFTNWKRLIQIKIALKEPEKALKILNNCPMISGGGNVGDFYNNLPVPALISLPGNNTNAENTLTISQSQSQVILEKLKASGLKGSFKEAYEMLIEIYWSIGWDGLLNCRSKVFVMEKDYIEDEIKGEGEDCRNEKEKEKGMEDKEKEEKEKEDKEKEEKEKEKDIGVTNDTDINHKLKDTHHSIELNLKSPLNEPVQIISLPNTEFLKLTSKKLCERWLDNLILILFEDLRIFGLFSEEIKRSSSSTIKSRNVKEWFLLGKLANRLRHVEEAKLAYQKCLFTEVEDTNIMLSFEYNKIIEGSLKSLILIYCNEGRSQLALLCTLRLLNCQERVYTSLMHPSKISMNLCNLVERTGLKRLSADLRSVNQEDLRNSEGWKKLNDFFKFLKDSKVHGYDY